MTTPADPQVPAEPPVEPGGVPAPTADPALGNNPKGSGSSPQSGDPSRRLGPGAVTADPDDPAKPAGAPDGGREGEGGAATPYVPTTPGTAQGGGSRQAAPGTPVTQVPGVGGDVGVGTSPSPEQIRDRPANVTTDPDNPAKPAGSNTPPTTHPPVTGGA